jgi:hypothetical protein
MRRGIALLAVAVLVTAGAGCAGPEQEIDVDVRSELAGLALRDARAASLAVPLPPYVEQVDGEGDGTPAGWLVNPELAQSPMPSPTGSDECPFTDPRQEVVAATGAPTAPPAEATYEFFAQGLFEAVSADGGRNAVMPAETTRTVANVAWAPGATYYDFDMVVEAPHGTTTTRYRVILDDPEVAKPDVPRPVNIREPPPPFLAPSTEPPIVGTVRVGTPAQPGMYILSVKAGDDEPREFNGGAGMLLARWPVFAGDTVQAQASVGDLALNYTSTVLDKGQVEACGALLDSRAVRLTGTVAPTRGGGGGRKAGEAGRGSGHQRSAPATFDVTYHIATQYGGLVIADSRTTTVGSDATSSVVETVTARIKGAPEPPPKAPEPPRCPTSGPRSPLVAAGASIETPPVEATYRMRTPIVDYAVSAYEVNGIISDAGKLPTTLIRTVQNVEWTDDRSFFDYETRDDLGGSITTTRYRVIPEPPGGADKPGEKPEPGTPGMYLVSVTHPDASGSPTTTARGSSSSPSPSTRRARPATR